MCTACGPGISHDPEHADELGGDDEVDDEFARALMPEDDPAAEPRAARRSRYCRCYAGGRSNPRSRTRAIR